MTERVLLAQLNVQHLRERKLEHLRWLVVASLPVWLDAHGQILPRLLAWFAALGEASCLAMVVTYAALEHRWARRAAQVEGGPSEIVIHMVWTAWDEVRTALWYGLALVSLIPWVYLMFDRAFPPQRLSAVTVSGLTVLVLLVLAETVPRVVDLAGDRRVLVDEELDGA